MTQYCILKRTRGSLVPQSYLYATCQGNSQMNELARNILFKREFLRIWSQKNPHNYIRVLVQRALLTGEKLSNIISPRSADEGLFPLPQKVTTKQIWNPIHSNKLLLQQHYPHYSCQVKPGCKKWEDAYAHNRFVACTCSFPWVNSNKQK